MRPSSSVKPILEIHTSVKLTLSLIGAWASLALRSPEILSLVLALSVVYAGLLVHSSILMRTYAIIGLIAIFYLLCVRAMAQIPNWGFMFKGSVSALLVPFYRLGISTSTAIALAFSTDMGTLMRELNHLRLPHFIAIPLSVAVRFLPTFWDDVAGIRDVNRLRFNGQSFARQLLNPVRFWRTFCVPLIFRALHSADALALSASLKGVGVKGGLKEMPKTRFGLADALVLFAWLGVTGFSYYWQTLLPVSKGRF